jgi:hypothetical protein
MRCTATDLGIPNASNHDRDARIPKDARQTLRTDCRRRQAAALVAIAFRISTAS